MCDSTFLESKFGRQPQNYGVLAAIGIADKSNPNYMPTNFRNYPNEKGFSGFSYNDPVSLTIPVVDNSSYAYKGILPLKQQPEISIPYPYAQQVVF